MQRVRAGESSVLVLRGEAGVGKTALLEYVAEQASGCRVVRVAGVESEMELAFAGLHQLCAPLLDGLDGSAGPAARCAAGGVRVAGRRRPESFPGRPGGPESAGRGGRGAIRSCAWSTMRSGSIGPPRRRLRSWRGACWRSGSAMVFAVRDPTTSTSSPACRSCSSAGSPTSDARWLLALGLPGRLDEHVRDQIVAETRGNPLALLELPRGLTPAELAGGFGLPDARPLASRVEETFVQRVRALPRETQRLLLVAAAEPVGDVSLLWRAAERLGISGSAGRPAERGRVDRVRDPGAVPASAGPLGGLPGGSAQDRQEVHRALAEATDPEADPDRRAWHRAHAAAGPDEAVADGAGTLGRPRPAPGRRCGRGRVPGASGRADPGPGHDGERARSPPRRRSWRRGAATPRGAARDRGAHPARRASARAPAAAARADRVRLHSRQRRSAASSRCRQTARSARSRVGASRPTSRPSERLCTPDASMPTPASRRWPRRPEPRPPAPQPPAIDRSRSRRPGAPVHGGTRPRACRR